MPIEAHQIITDDMLVKILQNAKFAVLRCEVIFMGYYKHGDTVPTPQSPVDGYAYSGSEIQWAIGFYSPRAPGPSFASGQATAPTFPGELSAKQPANLYWFSKDIDDATGLISIMVSYFKEGGAETITRDGVVKIHALCQRLSVSVHS